MTNRARAVRVIAAILSVILTGCALVYWFRNTNDPRYIARSGERRIQQSFDPDKLQSWATNLLANYTVGQTNYSGPFAPPAYLRGVWAKKIPSAYIQGGYYGERPYVRVFWGAGGMGQWGLLIGARDFVPKSQAQHESEWRPGVYFFEDFR